MIFGIPLRIAVKPNLLSVFDMETNILYYHPMNSEGKVDHNKPLSCSFLKYYLDPLTVYEDINEKNKLIDREN